MIKKIIFTSILIVFFLFSCVVNETTGKIVATNRTDRAVTNLKIGNVSIGYLGPGMTTVVYCSVTLVKTMHFSARLLVDTHNLK